MAKRIHTLLSEQGTAIVTILTALSMTISAIVLAITGVFGGGPATSGPSPPKDETALKKRLNKLANALKRIAGKAVEAFPATLRSVVGASLSFFDKATGFVAEHT